MVFNVGLKSFNQFKNTFSISLIKIVLFGVSLSATTVPFCIFTCLVFRGGMGSKFVLVRVGF